MTYSAYNKYDALDFALDEYFQQWVYFPDMGNRYFWDDFLEKNPHKKQEVTEAKKLIELMDFKKETGHEMPNFDKLLKRIKATMKHYK
ncbi:hypothetical protein WJR50_16480 [Catalinimonas sp. 4WD22]|uniref:hypothetical protein n=1 Tax=Catalinimonas locisalis TaxID=3133978 RepID=UPI003100D098